MDIPDKEMQAAYETALYHLNSMYTKWSIPVSLFGHGVGWSGRFFGWDEMFCVFGAASSGKFGLSARTANFRKNTLSKAMSRVSHYSRIEEKNMARGILGNLSKMLRKAPPIPTAFGLTMYSICRTLQQARGFITCLRATKSFCQKPPIRSYGSVRRFSIRICCKKRR